MMRRLARLLRRLAHRLDPQPRQEATPDLSFVTSGELSEEIARRSDVVLLMWGRVVTKAGRASVEGTLNWEMRRNQITSVLEYVFDELAPHATDPKS